MKKALINGRIIMPDGIYDDKILIYDQHILDIVDQLDDENMETLDVEGKFISPGFIDIHIHGSNGSDVMDGTQQALETISKAIVKNGVTGYLATTMTLSQNDIRQSFDNVKAYMGQEQSGAQILGIHVEGPFINAEYKGAQNDKYIIAPKLDLVNDHMDQIKLLTVAPEVKGMLDFVKQVKQVDETTKFSIGHSAATYEEAMDAYKSGIDSTTHLFNGMTGLHHRKPGIVGAVLKQKPYFEIIADQIHVHTALYDIMGDCVGKDKMILITDAMCACQMAPGTYELGGQAVIVDETSARLSGGQLAGSILKMNNAIKNVWDHTTYDLHDVVNMATKNPSAMLGLEGMGQIKIGYDANFAVFDEQLDIEMTILDGQVIFRKEN